MAKRSKRSAAARRRRQASRSGKSGRSASRKAAPAQSGSEKASKAPAKEEPKGEVVDFASEYHYVLSDLKRFGILAASMVVLLVVLALVL